MQAVASSVAAPARMFEGGVSGLADAMAQAGARSAIVDAAVQAFFEVTDPLLQQVQQRIPAAMTGLRQTATAIIDGDDEIATMIDARAVGGFVGYRPPPGVRQAR